MAADSPEVWTFLSSPDLFNMHYADLSGGADPDIAAAFGPDYADTLVAAKGWTPGDVNSMNATFAAMWAENVRLMAATADNPQAVLVAGDLTRGGAEQLYNNVYDDREFNTRTVFERLFHDGTRIDTTTAEGREELNAALKHMMDVYGSWYSTLWASAGVEDVIAAIGDHELGGDPWVVGEEQSTVIPAYKEGFNQGYVSQLNIAETYQGVSARAPEGAGNYDEGSYVYQKHNVLFVTVDMFRWEGDIMLGTNKNQPSSAVIDVRGEHLDWVKAILAAAEDDATVDHVILQGHPGVLGPVNSFNSGELQIEGGEHSAFWKALAAHGPNNGGKVRMYFSGDVHQTTTIQDEDSGVVQLTHGTNGFGGAVDPTWISFEVFDDRIVGKEYVIENSRSGDTTVWQVWGGDYRVDDTVDGAPIEIGAFELDLSGARAELTVSGNLEAPVLRSGAPETGEQGNLTYVGGPGDDLHYLGYSSGRGRPVFNGHGQDGDDTIVGQLGKDNVFGGAGEDVLSGGAKSDLLVGGPDQDTLEGGDDADIFRFNRGDGEDVITDFEAGVDRIQIQAQADAVVVTQDGADAILQYEGGRIRVENADAATLAADIDITVTPRLIDHIFAFHAPKAHADIVSELQAGAAPFSDRDLTLVGVPEGFEDARLIAMRHSHRNVDQAGVQLSFDPLTDGSLYIGLDTRALGEPDWLQADGWTATGQQFVAADAAGATTTYAIYRSDMTAGERVEVFGPHGGVLGEIDNMILVVDDRAAPVAPPRDDVFGDSRYELGTPGLTWLEAKAEAEARGGKLLELDSIAETDFIMQTFWANAPMWIGVTDAAEEGVWRNAAGEEVGFQNWKPNQPNDLQSRGPQGQDYARINVESGQWGDTWNEETSMSIAGEIAPSQTIIEFDRIVSFDGSRYEVGPDGLTWSEAKAFAEARGGKLLEIDSAAENAFVMGALWNGDPIWLGLSDAAEEGVWRNAAGEAATYTNWKPGQPNNLTGQDPEGQDYARIPGENGMWGDVIDAHTRTRVGDETFSTRTIIEYDPQPVLQTGEVFANQPDWTVWHRVDFDETMIDPVVVMGPATVNGPDPVHARVRNVTADGFEFQLEEWAYTAAPNQGSHTYAESLSWVAVERGTHTLSDGAVIEAGVAQIDNRLTSVAYDASFDAGAVVLGQVASVNDAAPVVHRFKVSDADGFRVRLQEEQAADQIHADEAFHWIAFETGRHSDFAAGQVPGDHRAMEIISPTDRDGLFLADMQTMRGGDPAQLRVLGETDHSIRLYIEEEASADAELFHWKAEDVGWVHIRDTHAFDDMG